jgi:inositol-phosphate transport system ATP-binding protein
MKCKEDARGPTEPASFGKLSSLILLEDSFALYPHMKVYDNTASPLKAQKIQEIGTRKRVKSTSKFLGIQELLDRYPWELSGGEQQSVSIARALVKQPSVYLFDEPLI